MEAIPLPDASVDVVVSNCVISLSVDKTAVFAEAHRNITPVRSEICIPKFLATMRDIRLRRPWTSSYSRAIRCLSASGSSTKSCGEL
jgi:ubiquinone/menaquinone biosynthesis C-methylase UbiE